VGEGKLRLISEGGGDRDDSVARPHWTSHPLPFLDDLAVGLKDGFAEAGERLATMVCEFCYQLVDFGGGGLGRDGIFHLWLQTLAANLAELGVTCNLRNLSSGP